VTAQLCSCYDNDDGRPIREVSTRRDSLNHPPVLFHNGSGVKRKGKGAVYTAVYKFPQFAKAKRPLLQEMLQVTLQELN